MTNQESTSQTVKNIFEQNIKREITNFLTGDKYEMIGGSDMIFSETGVGGEKKLYV